MKRQDWGEDCRHLYTLFLSYNMRPEVKHLGYFLLRNSRYLAFWAVIRIEVSMECAETCCDGVAASYSLCDRPRVAPCFSLCDTSHISSMAPQAIGRFHDA